MHTCPNGLDPSIFHARSRSRRPEVPPDGYIVGTVAALRPEKRLDTLLEAFARLTELRHRLVIIGDGPCRNELATVARKLGITSRCTFVPATPDVASWYRSIDVFVLPSINESFPNSIMEAMACGCAVIASNVGGIPELISDQENGLLFDPANPADLARQLEVVLSNAAYRCALGVAAARTIQAEYTNDLAAQRFAAVYDELLSAGRR
jgi:glycosyltransferase involved in cell wall biosynthesis